MPFVKRDTHGQVTALFREQTAEAREYLPPAHADIQTFLGTQSGSGQDSNALPTPEFRPDMLRSDLEMIRVYEDLIDVLIGKHVVVLTDFPAAAQEKLMRRKRLRSSFSNLTEALTAEEEEGIF